MQVRELINTCQNQWKNLLTIDEEFIIWIRTNNGTQIKESAKYLLENKYYIEVYRTAKVSSWELHDKILEIYVNNYED